ncbi:MULTISPECIES: hypothetical protein [Lysinibacillus]|uniref:hypothetical protein n=1 Tax=Lysinibacillus TaxID=400634 RepID=UPI00083C9A51|nr:hypothetical protein [Lysinibacillus xylanilyticus]
MVYTVKSSEKLRAAGAEYETKALLYLMNFREDSDDVHYYIVDFFNDLTGMSRIGQKMWDIQSKGAKNSPPKAIGKELVTLYKNYLSEFEFNCFILFMGGISNSVRINPDLNVFELKNIKESAVVKIREGLIEECQAKTYIDNKDIDEQKINDFLSLVQFVVDDKPNSDYVKSIIKTHVKLIPSQEILNSIFNEIRDKQSNKKNSVVENITIETCHEALNYGRHLTTGEIRLLAIARIINRDPFEKGVPLAFYSIISKLDGERQKDIILESQLALSKALYNKNNADNFWKLFENVYHVIMINPNTDVNKLYSKLDLDLLERCMDFDVISLKYFISLIKDGIEL